MKTIMRWDEVDQGHAYSLWRADDDSIASAVGWCMLQPGARWVVVTEAGNPEPIFEARHVAFDP